MIKITLNFKLFVSISLFVIENPGWVLRYSIIIHATYLYFIYPKPDQDYLLIASFVLSFSV